MTIPTIPLLFLCFACSPQYVLEAGEVAPADGDINNQGDDTGGGGDGGEVHDTGGDDTGDTGEAPDYSEYDGANLVIHRPLSGDFLPYGLNYDFEAVVYDAAGEPMKFDEINWTSDIDSVWEMNEGSFRDNSLDAGTHALTAVAELPNGDRLAYTIGGVLVQAETAGTYVGNLVVDGTYDAYSIGCSGASTVYVDIYGEQAWGDASCIISVQGYELTMDYLFDLEVNSYDIAGDAALDLAGLWEVPISFTGNLDGVGHLTGSFADNLLGFLDIEGNLDVERISRETQEP